jgi:translocation and assembly module TamB
MTNPSQNPPPESSNSRSLMARLFRIARHPVTIVIGVSTIAIAGVGYAAARYFIFERLSPLLEAQLSEILKRPVDVGEVESVSWTLNRIRIGATSVPATAKDRDRIALQSLEVGFNPFPLLLGQPLPIEVAIAKPDIFLDRNKQGEWVDLNLEPSPQQEQRELPVDIDVSARIDEGKIALLNRGAKRPINIQVDGEGGYIDANEKQVRYDLDATVLNSKINAKGETVLDTGKTQADIVVEKLAIAELVALIPNSPIQVRNGQFATDLNLNLPSVDDIENTRGQGNITLQQLEANIQSIKEPVRATLDLDLEGQKVLIEQARASIGRVVDTQIAGEIDWQQGFDLDVKVDPVNLANLARTFSVALPVSVGGEVRADLQVRGDVEKPVVTGKLNNTQPIRIDKTRFRQVSTDFQANLDRVTLKSLQIRPSAGGQILGSGTLETNIGRALEANEAIDPKKMPLNLNIRAQQLPTEEILSPYYRLSEDVTIGRLAASGRVGGTLNQPTALLQWRSPRAGNTPGIDVSGRGEAALVGKNIVIRNTFLQTDEGTARVSGNGNLDNKQWQTVVKANDFALQPFLAPLCTNNSATYCSYIETKNPFLETANVLLSGRLDSFAPETLNGVADLTVRAEEGFVDVKSRITKGLIRANAIGSQLDLNPFVPNLNVPVSVRQTRVNVSGAIADLLDGVETGIRRFKADGDVLLGVAGDTVAASGTVENGLLEAVAATERIALSEIFPAIGLPTQVQSSRVNLTGNLVSLLTSLDTTPDFSSFRAQVNSRIAVAEGIVTAVAQLENNLWQSDLTASDLKTTQILRRVQPGYKGQDLADLNGLVRLSGSIAPLFRTNGNLPVRAQTVALRLEDETLDLNANGGLLVSNLFSAPDIDNINFNVRANSDLDRLPLTELVATVPVRRQLLPQRLDVTGDGQFQGRLAGNNLISAPAAAGNVRLAGNLRLLDFTLNNRPFDPVLNGPVTVAPGEEIALNLRGEDDIIAANLEPCIRPDCRAPYLVSSLNIQQTTDGRAPILAQAEQVGDRLVAQVQNFPLELLSIVPGEEYGLLGTLQGQLSADIDLNPYTLTGRGNIAVDRPTLGNRRARAFNASFAYENNIARLDEAILELDRSRYEGEGAINLASGEIDGRLQAERGYVQDVTTALQVFDVPTLVSLLQFKKPDYATAQQVQPRSLGSTNATIAQQVNLLWEIDKQIRALVAQREAGGVPTELDIRGEFNTLITLDGTLRDPQVDFQFRGTNWEWHPQPSFVTIVAPLGLVKADTEIIPIDNIVLEGSLRDGIVAIEPARLRINDSLVTFQGGLRTATRTIQPSELVIENLSVDTVNNFIKVPADIAGNLKAKALISGPLLSPKVDGQYNFTNASFNGRIVDRPLAGSFNYNDSRLDFRTTENSLARINGSIPFPTTPETNDRVALDVQLGTEALELLDVFSQGQVSWQDGEGDVTLKANGRMDLREGFRVYDLQAKGVANLKDATLLSAAFPEPLKVNGRISLNNQLLNVEQLEGNFAQSKLSAQGVLPLFIPISRRDPNANNPLTVAIERGEIDLTNLYRGGIDGKVTVTGAAILPTVRGNVRLRDGRVFVPQRQQQAATPAGAPVVRQPGGGGGAPRRNDTALFIPRLDNLQVALENLVIDESVYNFRFGGNLALSGPINGIANLQPTGTITLNRGRVSLLETRFLLDRRYENAIVFNPERGLLDPELAIRLRTIVSELPDARRQVIDQNNEIPDDNFSRVRRVDISLILEGQVSQLLPNLGRDASEVCQIQSSSLPPIPGQRTIPPEQIERLETCLQLIAGRNQSDSQILGNPAIELTSTPTRSEGEIVRLLSQQFLSLADALQNKNTDQLLEYGLVQLAIPFLLQGVVYDIENAVGNTLGTSDLTLFPLIQTSYQVDEKSFVGVVYDYSFNEVRVEYRTRF